MKIIYMGTPDFAVPCLKTLISSQHEVIAVYTQPDKPKGRGYALAPPPVKVTAVESGIPVFQPTTLKTDEEFLKLSQLNPDIIIVAAYGKLLPKRIIDLPKYGCINLHGSLLPKYRGAAPIQWAVINGEKQTGITVMQMNEGLDTGDMLIKCPVEIGENETAAQLHDKLAKVSADIILDAIEKIENGELTPEKQDDSQSCYSPMLDKSICRIDWSLPAQTVHNKVRGLNSWPVSLAEINGKRVKIYLTEKSDACGKPGEIIAISPLTVACGENSVIIKELQLEGKKRMNSEDFLRGHKLAKGQYFK